MRKGELPTHQDWEEHLIEAHASEPRMTPEAYSNYRTDDGKNSYELLAAKLPASKENLTVVDLACGDGHLIPYLLPRLGPKAQVYGVDISQEGLDLARADINDSRVKFALSRAQSLPLESGSVDKILCHMAIMLMNPVEPVVDEIRRVLKPGGSFSAAVGSGAAIGLYQEIRRLVGVFMQTHLPRYFEARQTRINIGSEEGIKAAFSEGFDPQIELLEVQLRYHVPPEGIWTYLQNMYFIPMMPEHAQRELKDDLLSFARAHLDPSGRVLFYVPMRMFTVSALG